MRLVVERDPGRWFTLPWVAKLYSDENRTWIGFGAGFTRSGAIRRAFSEAAERAINPDKDKRPEPVQVEDIPL